MERIVICTLLFLALVSCGTEVETDLESDAQTISVESDTSSSQVSHTYSYKLEYAKGFAVQEYQGNTHVIVFDGERRVGEYMLYKGEEPEPIPGVTNLKVPISTIACLSTTYLPYIARLGHVTSITGVANAQFVKNGQVREQIDIGFTRNISAEVEVDIEKVVDIDPNILMVYPFNSPDYSRLQKLGIKLFYNTEYQEQHPLGQVEWIKLFGLLYDEEQVAFDVYNHVRDVYNETKQLAAAAIPVPIMAGSIFDGKWSAPGGASMGAKLMEDAGADYIWDDPSTGSYTKDIETAITDSENADYLAMISSFKGNYSLNALKAENPKYNLLHPVEEGNVLHCNTATVNYFEDALLEPHIILKDLVHLLHTDILPDHKLKYFRPLK